MSESDNEQDQNIHELYNDNLASSCPTGDPGNGMSRLRSRIRREGNIRDIASFGFSLVVMTLLGLLSRLSLAIQPKQKTTETETDL